ncbi:MAG: BrnT family toxin [Deltaproteobacteria bacterium]|nr:BrnT family toxin [Deltaproteobacteria bacterium]
MRGKTGWLWDEWNTDHIAQHDVEPFEAEGVGDHPRYVERWRDRYLAWGPTIEGRFLLVVYVRRKEGRYVISARDIEEGEKKRLRRLTGR